MTNEIAKLNYEKSQHSIVHCRLALSFLWESLLDKIKSNFGFWGEGKPEFPEKGSRCTVENQQTQHTFDSGSKNRARAILVGGECSHHCAIPVPHNMSYHEFSRYQTRPAESWSNQRYADSSQSRRLTEVLGCRNLPVEVHSKHVSENEWSWEKTDAITGLKKAPVICSSP